MPICSTVRSSETATGSQVTGEVCETSGGGGNDCQVEVIMTIDSTHVVFVSSDPPHFKQTTADGHIQVWWRDTLQANKDWPFKVKLKCKAKANGPTPVALAICSQAIEPPNKQRFLATTHTMYHGHKCNHGAGRNKKVHHKKK